MCKSIIVCLHHYQTVKNIIVYGASVNMLPGTVHCVLESVSTVEGSYAKECF